MPLPSSDTIQKIADDIRELINAGNGISEKVAAEWESELRSLSARASAGEGGLQAEVKDAALGVATIHVDQSYFGPHMIGPGKKIRIFVDTAAPQPAQAGASGGGVPFGWAKAGPNGMPMLHTATYNREKCDEWAVNGWNVVPLYTTPASPATGRQADEQYRGEEWQCCGNEKSGSCCGKYERVWHEDDDSTPQPAADWRNDAFNLADTVIERIECGDKQGARDAIREEFERLAAAPKPQTCDCGAKPSTDADQARHSADCGSTPPAHTPTPDAWWNGQRPTTDGICIPSINWDREDTNHDIPLFAGFNPQGPVMRMLAGYKARAEKAEAALTARPAPEADARDGAALGTGRAFNPGDRVEWQSSFGDWFPAKIVAVKDGLTTYTAKLDDGTTAPDFAAGRFRKLAMPLPAQGREG